MRRVGLRQLEVAVRVQHAAGRDEPLARLLATLPDGAADVVTDDGDPNPWRGYQRCLERLPDGHVCILQDDTVACRNLVETLPLIAAANPSTPVCLFLGGLPKRTGLNATVALQRRSSYAWVHAADFVPVVAILWPTAVAARFLTWTRDNPHRLGHHAPRSDDAVCARFMRFTGQRFRVTVPSLVQHPDDTPSTVGLRHKAGLDTGRVARYFIGDGDPLTLDWTDTSAR